MFVQFRCNGFGWSGCEATVNTFNECLLECVGVENTCTIPASVSACPPFLPSLLFLYPLVWLLTPTAFMSSYSVTLSVLSPALKIILPFVHSSNNKRPMTAMHCSISSMLPITPAPSTVGHHSLTAEENSVYSCRCVFTVVHQVTCCLQHLHFPWHCTR